MDSSSPRRHTPSSSPSSPQRFRGLDNSLGENNCFLNSIVQCLVHLPSFLNGFGAMEGHTCVPADVKTCVVCALQALMAEYVYGVKRSLPVRALREAIAATFADKNLLQAEEMHCAMEASEELLEHLRKTCGGGWMEGTFLTRCVVAGTCGTCNVRCRLQDYPQLVQYVHASKLRVLGLASQLQDQQSNVPHSCDDASCRGTVTYSRAVVSCPSSLAIGVIWKKGFADAAEVAELCRNIPETITPEDVGCQPGTSGRRFTFRGMVCYYGKHYVAYVRKLKSTKWYHFDDRKVKPMDGGWAEASAHAARCSYQPFLLYYDAQEQLSAFEALEGASDDESAEQEEYIPPPPDTPPPAHAYTSCRGVKESASINTPRAERGPIFFEKDIRSPREVKKELVHVNAAEAAVVAYRQEMEQQRRAAERMDRERDQRRKLDDEREENRRREWQVERAALVREQARKVEEEKQRNIEWEQTQREQRRRDVEVAAMRRPLGYGSGFTYEERYSPRVAPPTTHSRIFPPAYSPTTALPSPRLFADRGDMQSTTPQPQPRFGGVLIGTTPRTDTYTTLAYGTGRAYGGAAPRANSAAPGQRPTANVTRPLWQN